jgi:hypothetical protein
MPQCFRLDRAALGFYLALGMAGCTRSAGAPVVPVAAQPVSLEQVRAWVAATEPVGNRLHRFKWLFQDERSSAGGRGSVRIAAPDSLRFDVSGPFGAGSGAAAIVGEAPLWIEPPDALDKVVPSHPLLWAMFGVARLPRESAALRGLADGNTTAWEYVSGPDTVEYARTTGSAGRLITVVRQAGKIVGRAETRREADGMPVSARLVVPEAPARLDITFTASTRPSEFPSDIWLPRPR